ncbi:uncharacterized protein LOC128998743 [Macrosteles quadrilineatus]|uniref:uncharacterized protein LOC128998743 n=1 Tax=Macrosteles quadrilineatus TaxID=74068 RepID=UPI0023E1C42A|nr:uncharacterized protein LOC128998743 [Macrosteles quadrilineatus]
MRHRTVCYLIYIFIKLTTIYGEDQENSDELLVMDFTSVPQLNGWMEMSDVLKQVGKSKAALVLHKTRRFQRGILFTMLNPQPDGAGFAGFRTDTQLDLSDYSTLQLFCRGQGDYYGYKVVLRHNGQISPSYEHMFQAPIRKFETVVLPLSHFEPYFRGRKREHSPPLDTSNITSVALLMYGGGYLPVKQSGTSSLEINWIKAV